MLIVENIVILPIMPANTKQINFICLYVSICICTFASCLCNLIVYCEHFAMSWTIFQEREFNSSLIFSPKVGVNFVSRHLRFSQFFSIVDNVQYFSASSKALWVSFSSSLYIIYFSSIRILAPKETLQRISLTLF